MPKGLPARRLRLPPGTRGSSPLFLHHLAGQSCSAGCPALHVQFLFSCHCTPAEELRCHIGPFSPENSSFF